MGWKDRATVVAPNSAPQASSWRDRATPVTPEGAPRDAFDMGPELFDYGSRALDYAGGLGRYAAAGLLNLPYAALTGKSLTKPEDLKAVATGKGPSTSEYMERGGVPEGPSVGIPFTDKRISARDVGGFAGDVATDPLTYLGFPGSKIAAEGTEALGKKVYKSGFKKIDERLAEQGKKPISDVLLESGAPTGTTKTLAKDMKNVGADALAQRDELYKKGVTVDLGHPLEETEAFLAKARKTPGVRRKLGELDDILTDFKREGKVDLKTLSEWKSSIYDSLPEAAFGPDGKPRGLAGKFDKALSSDLRKSIIEAGNKAEPGLGNQIDKLNETMGSVISAKKPTKIQIRRGETPNLVTSVDAILAGVGHGAALPLKKGADLSKTTWARTKAGKGLINAADSGLVDPVARRTLINYMDKKKQK